MSLTVQGCTTRWSRSLVGWQASRAGPCPSSGPPTWPRRASTPSTSGTTAGSLFTLFFGNPVVMFLSLSEFYTIPLISNVIYVNIYSNSTILSIPISRIPGVLSATTLWGTGRRATCPWRSTLSSFPCVALSVACPSAIFPLKVRGNYIRILNHL